MKLLDWLVGATVFLSLWFEVITSDHFSTLPKEWQKFTRLLPVAPILLFGLYAFTTILYQVFSFNTCESAAIELQQQIEEAKKDLQSKGVML